MIFNRGLLKDTSNDMTEKDLEILFDFLDSYDEHYLESITYHNGDLSINIQQQASSNPMIAGGYYPQQDVYRGLKPIENQPMPLKAQHYDSTNTPVESQESKSKSPNTGTSKGKLTIHATMSGSFYPSKEQGKPALVKVGDRVSAGQSVCLLEAMKLFTEIKAEVDGTITKIFFKEGDIVTEGDVLFELQP